MRCVFVVETAGGASQFTMVKNKIAIISNDVDMAIEPPIDGETRLDTFKHKWKAVHALNSMFMKVLSRTASLP
jgi:hypothetical protein